MGGCIEESVAPAGYRLGWRRAGRGRTRCKYVPVSSIGASMRLTVLPRPALRHPPHIPQARRVGSSRTRAVAPGHARRLLVAPLRSPGMARCYQSTLRSHEPQLLTPAFGRTGRARRKPSERRRGRQGRTVHGMDDVAEPTRTYLRRVLHCLPLHLSLSSHEAPGGPPMNRPQRTTHPPVGYDARPPFGRCMQ